MVEKYGHYALVTSYFIPVVRHIVPYLVGMNNMSFRIYALYSYTTGFVWTLIYFVLGSLFGQHIERIVAVAIEYGVYFGVTVVLIGSLFYVKRSAVVSSRGGCSKIHFGTASFCAVLLSVLLVSRYIEKIVDIISCT